MIFFYNRKTGQIFSTVFGREHPKEVLETLTVKPSDIDEKDIGKYAVPYKTLYEEKEEPIYELRVTDMKTGKIDKVFTGVKKVVKANGMEPDVPFKDIILEIEEGKTNPHEFKIEEKGGKITGMVKNLKP